MVVKAQNAEKNGTQNQCVYLSKAATILILKQGELMKKNCEI
jgi:hypothetical protein